MKFKEYKNLLNIETHIDEENVIHNNKNIIIQQAFTKNTNKIVFYSKLLSYSIFLLLMTFHLIQIIIKLNFLNNSYYFYNSYTLSSYNYQYYTLINLCFTTLFFNDNYLTKNNNYVSFYDTIDRNYLKTYIKESINSFSKLELSLYKENVNNVLSKEIFFRNYHANLFNINDFVKFTNHTNKLNNFEDYKSFDINLLHTNASHIGHYMKYNLLDILDNINDYYKNYTNLYYIKKIILQENYIKHLISFMNLDLYMSSFNNNLNNKSNILKWTELLLKIPFPICLVMFIILNILVYSYIYTRKKYLVALILAIPKETINVKSKYLSLINLKCSQYLKNIIYNSNFNLKEIALTVDNNNSTVSANIEHFSESLINKNKRNSILYNIKKYNSKINKYEKPEKDEIILSHKDYLYNKKEKIVNVFNIKSPILISNKKNFILESKTNNIDNNYSKHNNKKLKYKEEDHLNTMNESNNNSKYILGNLIKQNVSSGFKKYNNEENIDNNINKNTIKKVNNVVNDYNNKDSSDLNNIETTNTKEPKYKPYSNNTKIYKEENILYNLNKSKEAQEKINIYKKNASKNTKKLKNLINNNSNNKHKNKYNYNKDSNTLDSELYEKYEDEYYCILSTINNSIVIKALSQKNLLYCIIHNIIIVIIFLVFYIVYIFIDTNIDNNIIKEDNSESNIFTQRARNLNNLYLVATILIYKTSSINKCNLSNNINNYNNYDINQSVENTLTYDSLNDSKKDYCFFYRYLYQLVDKYSFNIVKFNNPKIDDIYNNLNNKTYFCNYFENIASNTSSLNTFNVNININTNNDYNQILYDEIKKLFLSSYNYLKCKDFFSKLNKDYNVTSLNDQIQGLISYLHSMSNLQSSNSNLDNNKNIIDKKLTTNIYDNYDINQFNKYLTELIFYVNPSLAYLNYFAFDNRKRIVSKSINSVVVLVIALFVFKIIQFVMLLWVHYRLKYNLKKDINLINTIDSTKNACFEEKNEFYYQKTLEILNQYNK